MWQYLLILLSVWALESPTPVASTTQPVPEINEYLAVRGLYQKANPMVIAEQATQHKLAREIAETMVDYYEGLETVSFTVTDEVADYDHMGREAWRKKMISARVVSQPGMIASEVDARSGQSLKPLWRFYLNKNMFGPVLQEFKYPWNGLPGQHAFVNEDVSKAHLFAGVDSHHICDMAKFVQPWVGKDPWMITTWQRMISTDDRGRYVGLTDLNGEKVHVIVLLDLGDDKYDTQWDVLYIKRSGLVLRRVLVNDYLDKDSKPRHQLRVFHYSDFSWEKVPLDTFSPPEELLNLVSKDQWGRLTEDQAQGERRVALGQN